MANWFDQRLPLPRVPHSMHDLSHNYKTSLDFGTLVPDLFIDCMPGDSFKKLKSDLFLRLAPMTFPIMHRLNVRQHYFAVPYRLVLGDENYEDFLNGTKDLVPFLIGNTSVNSVSLKNTVFDYLGFFFQKSGLEPLTLAGQTGETIDSIEIANPVPFIAYYLIWKNYFADEVLDATWIGYVDDIVDAYRSHFENQTKMAINQDNDYWTELVSLAPISYTKDYFTSAQINTQRGTVVPLISASNLFGGDASPRLMAINSSTGLSDTKVNPDFDGSNSVNSQIYQSLRVTSSETILDLWKKEQMQRFLEVDNVFGTRVFEKLAGHWGVISSDARIQKPRFLGGTTSPITISEVLQTSASIEDGNPLGTYAGRGTMFKASKNVKFFCEENTIILGLVSIKPDNGYITSTQRSFFKKNFYDFAVPEFNNIGYQPIYKGEIFNDGTSSALEDFAYQPRYSEYRCMNSIATGDFRDTTMLAWHLNRKFSSLPPYNRNFVHVNKSDSDRIFAVTDSNTHFYLDAYHDIRIWRPITFMPDARHL